MPGPAEMTVLWSMIMIGGLAGAPLSVPPLPEDPALARIAPQECLWYMSAAGMATPDSGSANKTEQLLAEPERSRVIDHPHLPIRGPQQVARVAVAVLNELVEHAQDMELTRRARRVRPRRLLLLTPALVQHDVIDPPGHRCAFPRDLALDGHRDVVEAEQS